MPPANTATEDDYPRLAGDLFGFSSTRYGVHQDLTLRQRLDCYNDELPSRLSSFGHLPLHAIVACCSGNHYIKGFAADLRDCREAADAHGVTVVSTTVAVVAWLRHCGADAFTIVSPFAAWLDEVAAAYWASAGLRVAGVLKVTDSRTGAAYPSAYDVATADIVAAVRAGGEPTTPTLLIGTGMHTREALATLAEDFDGRQFHSSNSCGAEFLRLSAADADPLARLG